ncbi:ABC transporter permease [Streptococcus sp. X16XC17]|uniref:hypothetical protein n=1 Tax=unclassified Streptococcus TaxID=2608887 RepID=UPI00069F36C4|nr:MULTISPECIES: hypothetical protein [unclassified Streptococcus]TCD46334.1 ABC transporter permease [Streptococcus sp. X16XC17]
MIAEKTIGDLDLYFYIPIKAFLVTILLMGGLFIIVSLIAPIILKKKKIIALLKKEEKEEKSYILATSILFITVSYITIYLHEKVSIYVYPLYLITFILGTYCFFYITFFIYERFMNLTSKKFDGNGLVKVGNFKYYMNTNLKTMTINMVLFSIILSSLIVIVGAPQNVEEVTEKIMPYSYMYAAWDKNINEKAQVKKIKDVLKDKEGYKDLQIEYSEFRDLNRDIIISNSVYNDIAQFLDRKTIKLNPDEYFMVGVDGKNSPRIRKLLGEDFEKLGIKKEQGSDKAVIALSGYFSSITVLENNKYENLSKKLKKERIFAFSIKDWKQAKAEETEIRSFLKIDGTSETLASAYSYYYLEKLQRSIVAYVGSILCVSFLIGIASTTYSRLYSSSGEEISKYKTMVKLGMAKDLIQKSLSSTIKWVFVLSFILALFIAWYFIYTLNQYTLVSYNGNREEAK